MGDKQRDPDSGRYTSTVSDEQLLALVADHEPAGTVEVAEALEWTQPAAYKRLRALQEAGRLHSKKIGGTRVWMTAP